MNIINNIELNINYESDSASSYLVLAPNACNTVIDYQAQMLLNNKVAGLLDFNINYKDESVNFFYNITSKCSLSGILKRKSFSRDEFLITIHKIINNINNIKNYLLYDFNIILDVNYIYLEPDSGEVSFVYLPVSGSKNDYKEFFIELIIKLVKFNDEDSDNYIQKILENVKGEIFSLSGLKNLIEKLLGEEVKKTGFTAETIKPEYTEINELNGSPKIKIPVEKMETPKIKSCNVKIPNSNNFSIKQRNTNIKENTLNEADKSTINAGGNLTDKIYKAIAIFIQPIFIVSFLLVVKSSLITVSDNPKLTQAILFIIFLLCDILIIRIINQKTNTDNQDTVYKPLQHIQDKMKASKVSKALKEEENIDPHFLKFNNYQGETTVIKKPETQYKTYLKEKDDDLIFSIEKQSTLFGRMPEIVDHVINSHAVGKIHAEIINEESNYYIIDLNSKNGTYINNVRISSNDRMKIGSNDTVKLADKEFTFICDTSDKGDQI